MPLPEKLANAPELDSHLLLYWQAFHDLDSERTHFDGPTPIPWSAIVKWCEFKGLDYEASEDVIYFVKKLDDVNLKRVASRQNAAAKKAETAAKLRAKSKK